MSASEATERALDQMLDHASTQIDEASLREQALNELSGFGVLQPFMADPAIEEIWINEPGRIRFYGPGGVEETAVDLDEQGLKSLVLRMLRDSGRRLDRLTPFVDAALVDGSRLHVVIPDLTKKYWAVNIRKFKKTRVTLAWLQAQGVIDSGQHELLKTAIVEQKSLLIAGATQAGKTTLMTALLNELHANERLVSCEDTFELNLDHPDWVAMQTRPSSPEGAKEISLRELVKQALRMRPSRLVIGEVRGAEALDMLVALNSGIPGVCTLHANSAFAALQKLLTLPLLAGENITDSFLRPTVLGAFDLVLFCKRLEDGSRRLTEIVEVEDALFSRAS